MKSFVTLLIGVFGFNSSLAQVKFLESIEVDSVTSDFPVNFSILQQSDWQFVDNFNKDRTIKVTYWHIKNGY